MNKQAIHKFFIIVFLVALTILACHFHLDDSHCPLCDLLATGFTCAESTFIQVILLFVTIIRPIIPIQSLSSSNLGIQLRAPPFLPNP
jgi:hypothetical protein